MEHQSAGGWVVNTIMGRSPNLTEPTNIANFANDMIAQYVGYDARNGSWGLPSATLVLLAGGIGSKIANKVAPNTFTGLPMVGNKIKW